MFKLASTIAASAALTVSLLPMAEAQQACGGFSEGCAVKWVKPPPQSVSTWRAGNYTGVVEGVTGGMAGQKGAASQTVLVDLSSGRLITVHMNQLSAIRCFPEEWRTVPALGRKVKVCHFQGNGVQGDYGVEYIASLRVRLLQEVVLSDGTKASYFASGYDSFGNLSLGQGVNDWASSSVPAKPPSPTPPSPGRTVEVGEIGQAFAQALKVDYPSVVQGTMGQQDYDTVLFDFPGGAFHARARSQLNLVIDLLDANGKALSRSFGPGGFFDMNLPAGRYGLIVRVMNHAGTGSYEITLGSGAGVHYRER